MKISLSICSPVIPLYKMSFPLEWYPCFVNSSPNTPIFCPLLTKAVQSPKPPLITHALPISVSISCPMVIRDGIACGLIIISGFNPSFVKGISASGITSPTVPFWPHREANLSPILGILTSRILTLAIR